MKKERFVDSMGTMVPMSEFMKEEVWRSVEGITNSWTRFEVSNYGNMRYYNNKTGRKGTIMNKRVSVMSGNDSVRMYIPVIMLNVFMGESFKSGDSLCYIDGDKNNNRLDNVFRLPADEESEYSVRIFLRNSYPNPKLMKRAHTPNLKVGHPQFGVVITNRKLLRMVWKSLVSVFSVSTVPVPASILYGCLVDNFGGEVKDVMSLSDFIAELPDDLCVNDDHKSFLLCMDDMCMKPLPNDGFVSLRVAKEMKRVFGNVSCRYRYAVDSSNNCIVSFSDMDTPDGRMFEVYSAPDYFTAMKYVRNLSKEGVDNSFDINSVEPWMYSLLSEVCMEGGGDE